MSPMLVEGKNSIKSEVKEMKETIPEINKTKSWFFEKINKIGKPLARFININGGMRRLKSIKFEMKMEKSQ